MRVLDMTADIERVEATLREAIAKAQMMGYRLVRRRGSIDTDKKTCCVLGAQHLIHTNLCLIAPRPGSGIAVMSIACGFDGAGSYWCHDESPCHHQRDYPEYHALGARLAAEFAR